MRALDVVGEDLQLRVGVGDGVARQQQVAVGLFGVGLLRPVADVDQAVEDRPRIVVENSLVQLMTAAMRLLVIDHGMRVGVLVLTDHVKTID